MKTGKTILGILAGIGAGTVLGVLFAPKKGSETRENIAKKGDDLAKALSNKIDKKFDELISSIQEKTQKSQPQNDTATANEDEILD